MSLSSVSESLRGASGEVAIDVIRPWARDPDTYSSGITNTAYLMIKRAYAPPAERLKLLVAR